MTTLYSTTISAVGEEAGDLLDQGVLILFADGAPPELAEVSVLHAVAQEATLPPTHGDALRIGEESFRITAVGDTAWQKVAEMGHVVFSFNGADSAERPGEICIEPVPADRLRALLRPGATLAVIGQHEIRPNPGG